jgi:hypothetical protein
LLGILPGHVTRHFTRFIRFVEFIDGGVSSHRRELSYAVRLVRTTF